MHDVDLIPESDFNIYGCGDDFVDNYNDDMPRHLSLTIRKMNETHLENLNLNISYKPNLYELLVGGVLCIRPKLYNRINGFSNEYWNWGAEDDDLGIRMLIKNICVTRPDSIYALYKMSYHKKSEANPIRENLLFSTFNRMKKDGLSNFYRLDVESDQKKPSTLFTHLKVFVGTQPPNYYKKFNSTIIKKIN
ncbi:unnamed protein product [Brachionus calyciflorus]|uniref:Galactosyltransferase C-terminal domain-containing protein n=1 Tax=Brachionus calyciflorus TaxID=104777 RepID=A0A814F7C3_9BILA|nr:unnamed protein product [Brachionus calyciflorus]